MLPVTLETYSFRIEIPCKVSLGAGLVRYSYSIGWNPVEERDQWSTLHGWSVFTKQDKLRRENKETYERPKTKQTTEKKFLVGPIK